MLYNNVLGRTPDAGGRAVQVSFIDGALDGIKHGRGELLANFADSAEFVGKTQLQIAGALRALHETTWGGL